MRFLAACAVLTMVMITAGCSGSSDDSSKSVDPNDPIPITGTVAPVTTSEAPVSVAPALADAGTIQYESDGGYTWDVSVAFGSIRSVNDSSVDQKLVDACGADPSTAGFIPMRITMTSTADSLAEDTAASFFLSTNSDDPGPNFPAGVSWTGNFSSGPLCRDASTASGEPWTITHSQLEPGASTYTDGGLLIPDWITPDDPAGDTSYESMWLGQAITSGQYGVDVVWSATSASGLDIVDNNLSVDELNQCRWWFPVSAGA